MEPTSKKESPTGRWQLFMGKARNHFPEKLFLVVAAVVTGIATGLAAVVFKWCIGHMAKLVQEGYHMAGNNAILLILPLIGFLGTAVILKFIIGKDIAHGVDKIVADLKEKSYRLPGYFVWGPVVTGTFTLGFGGSAGSEGPIATCGAGVGSRMAQLFGITSDNTRLLLGCGSGAGIAAIFKAPVAGMLFALEVLKLPVNTFITLLILLACLIASLTCYIFTGFTFDLPLGTLAAFEPVHYIYTAVFGLFCGAYAIYYSAIMKQMGKAFASVKSQWLKAILGGIVVGVLLYVFPALYGEGYDVMGDILRGNLHAITKGSILSGSNSITVVMITAVGIAVVKSLAAGATTNGGVAGDFAPALFAGCFAGLVFSGMLNTFCGTHLPVADFALIGMAGVMAGVVRAPLMSMFLAVEMTGNYIVFLPIVLCSAISYCIVEYFGGKPVKTIEKIM